MVVTMDDLVAAFRRCAERLIEAKDILTYIDSRCGDGDLGFTIEEMGYCILSEIENGVGDNISDFIIHCARSINRTAPSTMGTLSSFSMIEAGKYLAGKENISEFDLVTLPRKCAETIMIYGRAHVGDKTVLDSLIPYGDALQEQYFQCRDIAQAGRLAALEASRAAAGTKGWIAKIGRAKWIGKRSQDCPDGGAVVCAIIVNALVDEPCKVDSFL